jgi:CRP-like cAMP-binding protein
MVEKREILKANPLFKSFSDEVIERFLNSAETRNYAAGEIIFAELSEGDEIFMILEGEAAGEIALLNADQTVEIQTGSSGQVFGEGCFFKPNAPRYATVTTKTPTTLLVWKGAVWREIAENDFEVGYRLALGFGISFLERLRQWNTRILENVSWGLE